MTEFLKPSFTVRMPVGQTFRTNWEETFKKKTDVVKHDKQCGVHDPIEEEHGGQCDCGVVAQCSR